MKRLVAFATLALACRAAPANGASPAPMPSKQEAAVSEQVVTIPDAGNIRVSPELEIGAGNIWPDPADGGTKTLSAGLWILAKKVSADRKHHRVHAGQELTESGYRFKVLEIVKGPDRSFVRVQVQSAR